MEAEHEADMKAGMPLADPLAGGGLPSPGGGPLALGAHQPGDDEHDPIPVPMPPPLMVGGEESGAAAAMLPPMEATAVGEAPVAADGSEGIAITDQDVLFGRGGLTNRHIGNLRYRDIISIHRQDYVRAQKTEKPNVARRIVRAIRTGKNPGRFLKKGDDGRWHEVSDKEAAWKASQALREKTRWSSMKKEKEERDEADADAEAAAAAAEAIVDSTVEKVVESANAKTVEKALKRKVEEAVERKVAAAAVVPPAVAAAAALGASNKKAKTEMSPAKQPPLQPQQPPLPLEAVPTQISHIAVPPVVAQGERRVGNNYMLPAAMNNNAAVPDIFPREEDILFGRGGRTNHHPGNRRLREIVNRYRDVYNRARKVDKPKVSKLIVGALRSANPPSRFLKMNDETALWEDVGDKRAAEKVSQTLREKTPEEKGEYLARKGAVERAEEGMGTMAPEMLGAAEMPGEAQVQQPPSPPPAPAPAPGKADDSLVEV